MDMESCSRELSFPQQTALKQHKRKLETRRLHTQTNRIAQMLNHTADSTGIIS